MIARDRHDLEIGNDANLATDSRRCAQSKSQGRAKANTKSALSALHQFFRTCPRLRFDIGKDAVAFLDSCEFGNFVCGNLACGFEAAPDVEQSAKLRQVSVEALF